MSGTDLKEVATQSRTTLWEQIAAVLRGRIKDGTYPAGSLLPPHQVLIEEFGVSHAPVEHACRALRNEGLLVAVPGRGTVVVDPLNPPTEREVLVRRSEDKSERWPAPGSNRDVVARIAAAVRRRIADGTYRSGARIPTVAELAEEFGARTWLAREAVDALKEGGLLHSRNPHGHFVGPDVRKARSTAALARQGAEATTENHTSSDGGQVLLPQGSTGGVR
ncbi:GntR family transcriptional regulator [Streptomyces sp. NPDC001073]